MNLLGKDQGQGVLICKSLELLQVGQSGYLAEEFAAYCYVSTVIDV